MNQQAWIDKAIGPRVVGGTYHNGYWGDTYTVEDIYRAPDASQWGMRVRWSDGHTTVHCTGWDAKRDRVVAPCDECQTMQPCSEARECPECLTINYSYYLCPAHLQAHTTRRHTTVPEHAPAGMLAVRVGGDSWTMVPLDEEQDARAEGASAMAPHFIAMSGTHACLPDYCSVNESAEAAAEALGYVHELSPRDVRRLSNTGYLELGGPEAGAEYAEIIGCDCTTPEDHDDN